MTNYLQNQSYTNLNFGAQVIKSSVATQTAATTTNLFTVSTGNVIVTSLIGVVTTVATVSTGNLSLGVTTTNKTLSTAIAAASTVLTTYTVGYILTPGANSAPTLSGAVSSGFISFGPSVSINQPSFVVPPGQITSTASAAIGGSISWYLTYVPLDFGAYVS